MLTLAAVTEELGDLEGYAVGIGPVIAAASTARLLARQPTPPAAVLLIGTGGAYPGRGDIGDVFVSERIGFGSGVAALGHGYVPRPPPSIAADPVLVSRVPVPRARVLTASAVSTEPELVDRLGDGWDVEHMEAFGVAWACREAGVPFIAVLGVANIVGPDAHVEWLTHREVAQDAAREVARAILADAALNA